MKVDKIRYETRPHIIPFYKLSEGDIFRFPNFEATFYIKMHPIYTKTRIDAYYSGVVCLGDGFNCMRIRTKDEIKTHDPHMELYKNVSDNTEVVPVSADLVICKG